MFKNERGQDNKMNNITDTDGICFIIIRYETEDGRHGVYAIPRSKIENWGLNICENGCQLQDVGLICEAFVNGFDQYRLARENSIGHFIEKDND